MLHEDAATVSAAGHIDEIDHIDVRSNGPHAAPHSVPKGAILSVSGWAALGEGRVPATGVYVIVDDGLPLEAFHGLPRSDVADFFENQALARSGFRGVLATSHLAAGPHVLSLAVRDEAGRLIPVETAESFTIDASLDHLVLESPPSDAPATICIDALSVDGQPASEPLEAGPGSLIGIRGWAIDAPAETVGAGIFAVVGTTVVTCTYGFVRDDVAEASGNPRLRLSGFSAAVPLDGIPAGEALIRLRLVAADGVTVCDGPAIRVDVAASFAGSVEPAPAGAATQAYIEEVLVLDAGGGVRPGSRGLKPARGEQLFVRGWAIDAPNAAPARAVHVCIDELPSTAAVYGLERGDVATALGSPQLAACGFTALVPTDSLAAGPHALALRVVARDGRAFYETLQRIDFTLV
jgi:hypothetical protein